MRTLRAYAVCLGAAATGFGCSPDNPERERPADAPASADSQFARFLSLSIATRFPYAGIFDLIGTVKDHSPAVEGGDVSGLCLDPEDYDERRWLADFRVLSVAVDGDSGEASAAITTVARQQIGEYWISTFAIEEDTAHWKMIRAPETGGQWKVCGGAAEGFELYASERPAQWLNGSDTTARAAIDSIRRARGLPLVR